MEKGKFLRQNLIFILKFSMFAEYNSKLLNLFYFFIKENNIEFSKDALVKYQKQKF